MVDCNPNKEPLGIVEVKRQSILSDKHAFGQIYDYMLRLQSFHGLKDVFGVLTTYEEWRICWFPEFQTAAEAQAVSATREEKERLLEAESGMMSWQLMS